MYHYLSPQDVLCNTPLGKRCIALHDNYFIDGFATF